VFIAGAITALTLGGGTAYAANGGSFLLGRSNGATATTTLANSAGTPLSLKARVGTAPLAVNSTKTVTNLNADLLDGVNGASMALTSGRTGIVYGSSTDSDHLPFTATCPTGTIATGGGGAAAYEGDSLAYSGPDFRDNGTLIPNSWLVMDDASNGAVAWVTCYNPRGAVPGTRTTLPSGAKAAAVTQTKALAVKRLRASASGR
jgi:hypothetical protein